MLTRDIALPTLAVALVVALGALFVDSIDKYARIDAQPRVETCKGCSTATRALYNALNAHCK